MVQAICRNNTCYLCTEKHREIGREQPQYATDSVHLHNENADVNVHNQEVIKQMPGLLKVYIATNEYGEKKYLHKISAPQKLHLKVDCRVMCLINKGEL